MRSVVESQQTALCLRYLGFSFSDVNSLADIALGNEEEVLGILRERAIPEVRRVEISVTERTCTSLMRFGNKKQREGV